MRNKLSHISKAFSVVFILSIINSLLSFIKEAIFAKYFGVSQTTDAFAIASQIPDILYSVVSVAIGATIIPLYSEVFFRKNKEEADKFVSKYFTFIVIFSLAFVVLGEIFTSQIVMMFAPGLDAKTHSLTVELLRVTFPGVLLTGLVGIFRGILHVHGWFGRAGISTVFRTLIYIACIIYLYKKYGIFAAAFGLLLGTLVEFLATWLFVKPKLVIRLNYEFHDERLAKAMQMTIPIIIGIGAAEINRIVEKIVASFLSSGSISALSYASRLSGAFSGIIISSISTVMYPQTAERAANNDSSGLQAVFISTLSIYSIIIVPIIFGAIVLRYQLVSIAFFRGAFSAADVATTSGLFACYMASMWFSAIRETGARLFYASGNTKIPMRNSLLGIAINIVLAIILSKYMAAIGLALASFISTSAICILMLVSTRKLLKNFNWMPFITAILKSIISASIMVLSIVVLQHYISSFSLSLNLIVSIFCGVFVYGIMLIISKTKELRLVFELHKNR